MPLQLLSGRLVILVFVVLNAIALIIYYAPYLFLGRCFYGSDHYLYFQPLTQFFKEQLQMGMLPLWNPYVHAGMAQVSIPSPGIFYPFNIYFAAFSYSQALALLLLTHQLIAATGAFLLLRSFRWGLAAAWMGGLAAGLNGYMYTLASNHTLSTTAAWIPLSLWTMRALEGDYSRQSLLMRMICAAICTAMLILAGRPEITTVGILSCAAYTVLWACFHKKTAALPRQAIAALLGGLLALPMVLPVIEWVLLSPRASGMKLEYVLLWSVNWYDLVSLIFAQPVGDRLLLGNPFLAEVADRSSHLPFLESACLGPVVFSLSIIGFMDRTWNYRWLILLFLAASLVMCLGHYTPIAPFLISKISALSIFRYPIKLLIVPVLILSLGASRGMFLLCQNALPRHSLTTVWTLWISATVLGALYSAAGAAFLPSLSPLSRALQLNVGISVTAGSMTGILTAALMTESMFGRKLISFERMPQALILLAAFSLVSAAFTFSNTPWVKADFFTRKPWLVQKLNELDIKLAPDGRLFNLFADPLTVPDFSQDQPGNNRFAQTFDYYQHCRDMLLANSHMNWKIPQTYGYEGAECAVYKNEVHDLMLHYRDLTEPRQSPGQSDKGKSGTAKPGTEKETAERGSDGRSARSLAEKVQSRDFYLWRLCQVTATKLVNTQIRRFDNMTLPLDPALFERMAESEDVNCRLYTVNDTLPRAFAASDWIWCDDQSEAVHAIEHGALPKEHPVQSNSPQSKLSYDRLIDLERTAIIERRAAGQESLASAAPAANAPHSEVAFVQDRPSLVALSAKLSRPAMVVLADQSYPGWKAYVNGIEKPLYRANAFMKAVYVQAGSSLIEFSYEPESVLWGLRVSLASLTVLFSMFATASAPSLLRFFKWTAGQT